VPDHGGGQVGAGCEGLGEGYPLDQLGGAHLGPGAPALGGGPERTGLGEEERGDQGDAVLIDQHHGDHRGDREVDRLLEGLLQVLGLTLDSEDLHQARDGLGLVRHPGVHEGREGIGIPQHDFSTAAYGLLRGDLDRPDSHEDERNDGDHSHHERHADPQPHQTSGGSTGNRTWKVVPAPGALSTDTLPRYLVTMR